MKSQKKAFIILVVLLVAIIGGYIASIYLVNNVEVVDNINFTAVIKTDKSDIKEIVYSKDEITIDLIKEDDIWKLKDDKTISLNQESVDNIVGYAANLNSKSTIDDPGDFSEYGFDEPMVNVKCICTNGEEKSYIVGDYFAMEDVYFAKTQDDDTIYTVSTYYYESFITDIEKLKEQ